MVQILAAVLAGITWGVTLAALRTPVVKVVPTCAALVFGLLMIGSVLVTAHSVHLGDASAFVAAAVASGALYGGHLWREALGSDTSYRELVWWSIVRPGHLRGIHAAMLSETDVAETHRTEPG